MTGIYNWITGNAPEEEEEEKVPDDTFHKGEENDSVEKEAEPVQEEAEA